MRRLSEGFLKTLPSQQIYYFYRFGIPVRKEYNENKKSRYYSRCPWRTSAISQGPSRANDIRRTRRTRSFSRTRRTELKLGSTSGSTAVLRHVPTHSSRDSYSRLPASPHMSHAVSSNTTPQPFRTTMREALGGSHQDFQLVLVRVNP